MRLPSESSSLELLASVERVTKLEQSTVILGDLVREVSSGVELSKCELGVGKQSRKGFAQSQGSRTDRGGKEARRPWATATGREQKHGTRIHEWNPVSQPDADNKSQRKGRKKPATDLVVVLVVKNVEKRSQEGVEVIEDRELGEDSRELLVNGVLGELDLSHVETSDSGDLEVLMAEGYDMVKGRKSRGRKQRVRKQQREKAGRGLSVIAFDVWFDSARVEVGSLHDGRGLPLGLGQAVEETKKDACEREDGTREGLTRGHWGTNTISRKSDAEGTGAMALRLAAMVGEGGGD